MRISTPELIRERSDAYDKQMSSTNPKKTGYTMASKVWPGLAKLIEESGEVTQVCGKIMSVFGSDTYYAGENLREDLQDEIGDLLASITYVIDQNKLDKRYINKRVAAKLAKYHYWKELNE